MTNNEIILNDMKYLNDLGVNLKIYVSITNPIAYVVESNAQKINFNAQELKDFLAELKEQVSDLEEVEQKKRRMMRNMLLEASEEIARKYNKQVYTLSIGDAE